MKRSFVSSLILACWIVLWIAGEAVAQQPATGVPPLSSFAGGPFDNVNLANLNVHFTIPVFSKAGKGIPFDYSLSYDSLVWVPVTPDGANQWTPVNSNWGWRTVTEAATGYVTYTDLDFVQSCSTGQFTYGKTTTTYYGFSYHDPVGGIHPFRGTVRVVVISSSSCGTVGTTVYPITNAVTAENSGYIVSTNSSSATGPATVNARGGLKIVTPNVGRSTGAGSVSDANSNTISISSTGVITDTLGATALTVSGTPPANVTYTYTAPSTGPASVTVSYVEYAVQTCFQVSNIYEYPNTQVPLVDKVTLPDGSYFQFYYEPTVGCGTSGKTTGRIASVTLPTGGVISYSYNGSNCGNNSNCMMADGSPSNVTRALGGGTWTYGRAEQPNETDTHQTWTSVTDPSGNITDIFFSGIYETARSVYLGSTRQTWLDYSSICYDGASRTSGCPQAILNLSTPRTERTVYDQPNNGSLYSEKDSTYDQYGNLTAETDYDYAASGNPILRQVIVAYNAPTLCSTYNICDHPSSTQVKDGTGTSKSYATYTYDEDGHTHGSVTTISRSTTGLTGGPFLSQHYIYNTNGTGTLVSATDPNGTVTTYNPTSCNNAFPTSATVHGPTLLTTSYAYNCTGGVVTQITDPNGKSTSASYTTDQYVWRPESTTDQAGNPTQYYYYPALSTVGQVESVMLFNGGNSVIDLATTPDSYGRPRFQQKREGPAGLGWTTFDTVETEYDSAGHVYSVSLPASCTLGQIGCATVNTTAVYDGMNRPTVVTAADGGNVNYSYNLNDVIVAVQPKPDLDQNTKRRQMQHDSLGRLSSVCELTSGSGSGCGQSYNPGTNGFVTSYTYDPLGNMTIVNQSGQTRVYSYDGLSRMTSETTPESGTATYTYDSATCPGGSQVSSSGDMVLKVDNAGNPTCFWYDGLHRVTQAGDGWIPGSNVCRRYAYDNATVNGVVMSNAEGHLAETKTDNCAGTLLTDEGFSYSARGEVADVYQSTPHSGGYYHVSSLYWADGLVNTLSGVPGMPTITYGVNVGGRTYTVSASSGQNPVTYAAYNAAAQLRALTFGSGDTDSFGYDSSTGRFNQYKYNVGATPQTVEGDLTWNQNSTLKTLAITDGINSAKSQTCTYVYDDLARVQTVNCVNNSQQNVWNQIFGFDVFGNITKTVPTGGTGISFQPTYSSSTNRFTSIPGVQVSYDGNGNLLQDNAHSYTWDRNWGNVASIDGVAVGLTFDALGRMVEQARGSSYTQIVYSPTGGKLALMNGQTLQKAFVPLPGGAQAVYNSSGLQYYRHSDWLGSSRLAVKPDRTVYSETAYGPYGEDYEDSGNFIKDLSFTGQNQDTVSGLYDFLFREQSPVQGRWLVPDPAGLAAVDITNPQTWNRYAYVMNNPLSYIDPLGLYLCIINGVETDRGCPGISGAPGAGGGGGFPIYTTGTCQSNTGPDGGAVYYSCLVFAGYTNGFGGGPGAGGAANNSTKQQICNKLPNGRVIGVSGGAGAMGATVAGGEIVLNYDTGQVTAFGFGGLQGGWNGVLSATAYTGLAWGLNGNNSNYSGGFSGFSAGTNVGVFGDRSSGGLTGGPGGVVPSSGPGTVTVVGVSASVALVGRFTFGLNATNYTHPAQLGRFWAFTPTDWVNYFARSACQ